jgi:hypothetical protein
LGFGFSIFIALIARILFMLRVVGKSIDIKVLIGFEIASLACILIIMVMAASLQKLTFLLACMGFSLVCSVIYIIDQKFYVYVTEDYKEE